MYTMTFFSFIEKCKREGIIRIEIPLVIKMIKKHNKLSSSWDFNMCVLCVNFIMICCLEKFIDWLLTHSCFFYAFIVSKVNNFKDSKQLDLMNNICKLYLKWRWIFFRLCCYLKRKKICCFKSDNTIWRTSNVCVHLE